MVTVCAKCDNTFVNCYSCKESCCDACDGKTPCQGELFVMDEIDLGDGTHKWLHACEAHDDGRPALTTGPSPGTGQAEAP